jgi:hypothetical protein
VDEYQLEIRSLHTALERLRAAEGDPAVIDEYESELRNLNALYAAAQHTHDAGVRDERLRRALADLGFGDWTLANVYSFVYEAAVEAEYDTDLATEVNDTDYAASLLDAVRSA